MRPEHVLVSTGIMAQTPIIFRPQYSMGDHSQSFGDLFDDRAFSHSKHLSRCQQPQQNNLEISTRAERFDTREDNGMRDDAYSNYMVRERRGLPGRMPSARSGSEVYGGGSSESSFSDHLLRKLASAAAGAQRKMPASLTDLRRHTYMGPGEGMTDPEEDEARRRGDHARMQAVAAAAQRRQPPRVQAGAARPSAHSSAYPSARVAHPAANRLNARPTAQPQDIMDSSAHSEQLLRRNGLGRPGAQKSSVSSMRKYTSFDI